MVKRANKTQPSGFLAIMFLSLFLTLPTTAGDTDRIPVYEEGRDAMYEQVADQLAFPISAIREQRSGVVHVSFTVDKNGNVTNIRAEDTEAHNLGELIISHAGAPSIKMPPGLEQESVAAKPVIPNEDMKQQVIQAIEKLGKFKPATIKGELVPFTFVISVRFNLV